MSTVRIIEVDPGVMIAYRVPDLFAAPHGEDALGSARRSYRFGRWVVVCGHRELRRLTRGSAERTLQHLAMVVLTREAIARARLDTYRSDREDRFTGWRAPI